MSRHSFDPEIAKSVGMNAAVIYQNILFWCEKNAANGKNIREGRAWTYNSRSAFEVLFPYLTPKQIRTALDKLLEVELLVSGVFNKDARDRTKWYAVPALDGIMQMPPMADTLAPEGQPLPDINPDINKPQTPKGADDLFLSKKMEPNIKQEIKDIEEGFQEFWKTIWPSHPRKKAKYDCEQLYKKTCLGQYKKAEKISPKQLNDAAKAFVDSVKDRQFLPAPLPWLREPGWEPFVGAEATRKPSKYARMVAGY